MRYLFLFLLLLLRHINHLLIGVSMILAALLPLTNIFPIVNSLIASRHSPFSLTRRKLFLFNTTVMTSEKKTARYKIFSGGDDDAR